MFGVLEDLTKAIVGIATLPLDVVKDTVTLGGLITDEESAIALYIGIICYSFSFLTLIVALSNLNINKTMFKY